MEKIKSIIKFWLKSSGFVEKYKKYYDGHPYKEGLVCAFEYIKDRFPKRGRTVIETDNENTYYVDNRMDNLSVSGSKMIKTGCFVSIINEGFYIVLQCEYESEKFTIPINDMLNSHIGYEYFSKSLYAYKLFEPQYINDTEDFLEIIFTMLSELQSYSSVYLCPQLYSFFTDTAFIDDFMKLYRSIPRDGYEIKVDKSTILTIVEKCGFIGKYYSKERFCRVEKQYGDVLLGYHIVFSYDLVNFIIYAKDEEQGLFFAPTIECYVDMFVNEKVKVLNFHSIEELQQIVSFMLSYIDVLGGYFIE